MFTTSFLIIGSSVDAKPRYKHRYTNNVIIKSFPNVRDPDRELNEYINNPPPEVEKMFQIQGRADRNGRSYQQQLAIDADVQSYILNRKKKTVITHNYYLEREQRANRNNLSYDEQYKMDSELESKYCPTDLKKPCNLDFDNPPQSSQ